MTPYVWPFAHIIRFTLYMWQFSHRMNQAAKEQRTGSTRIGSQVFRTYLSSWVANEFYMCCHWWKQFTGSTTNWVRKERLLLHSTPLPSANNCCHFSHHQSYGWPGGQAITERNPSYIHYWELHKREMSPHKSEMDNTGLYSPHQKASWTEWLRHHFLSFLTWLEMESYVWSQ